MNQDRINTIGFFIGASAVGYSLRISGIGGLYLLFGALAGGVLGGWLAEIIYAKAREPAPDPDRRSTDVPRSDAEGRPLD